MNNFIKKILILTFINTIYANEIQELKLKIDKLERENSELKEKIKKIENLLFKRESKDLTNPPNIQWIEPLMGWEVDYTNNRIYAVDNTGSSYNMNVGIGTNAPLSRFHLVGDFYNQGFTGAKQYFDPGVPSWVNVATLNYTSHGTGEDNSIVLIYAHLITDNEYVYADGFIRVLRDGTPIASACGGAFVDIFAYSVLAYFGITLVTYDEPGPGPHTYTLQRESVLPQRGYNFFIIELKR